ncbi:MAG: universal stress protein [Gammaproteobacteria bacterium]|nr:MAG: universal stress protein [Gammaproteobacteria bacterium]
MYRNILIPTDFSAHSKRAAERALELGRMFDARLRVVHVVNYLPPTFVTAQSEHTSAAQIVERATIYLAEWANEVGLESAEQLVTTGSAGKQIITTAKAEDVDLIVIGTSGEGGMKRLLGSTTRNVMHDAPCDVLSVHCG